MSPCLFPTHCQRRTKAECREVNSQCSLGYIPSTTPSHPPPHLYPPPPGTSLPTCTGDDSALKRSNQKPSYTVRAGVGADRPPPLWWWWRWWWWADRSESDSALIEWLRYNQYQRQTSGPNKRCRCEAGVSGRCSARQGSAALSRGGWLCVRGERAPLEGLCWKQRVTQIYALHD